MVSKIGSETQRHNAWHTPLFQVVTFDEEHHGSVSLLMTIRKAQHIAWVSRCQNLWFGTSCNEIQHYAGLGAVKQLTYRK